MVVNGFYLEKEDNNKCLQLYCKHQHQIAIGNFCQKASDYLYDKNKTRRVRHLLICGIGTIIHFKVRRFECDICAKPYLPSLIG